MKRGFYDLQRYSRRKLIIERLSYKPVKEIEKIINSHGFQKKSFYQKYYRFSILTDPELTIILGFKIPIYIPVKSEIPIELVSFKLSFYFRPRWVDQKFEAHLTQFISELMSFFDIFCEEFPFNHNFNIGGKEEEFLQEFNSYLLTQNFIEGTISDPQSEISEFQFYKHIRKALASQTAPLNNFIPKLSHTIKEVCSKFNLQRDSSLFHDLKHNIPFLRRNQYFTYTNLDKNEHLLVEPDTVSYWHDITHKHFWIRGGVESFCLFPLNTVQQKLLNVDINLTSLITNWIEYMRGITEKFFHFIDSQVFLDATLLQPFSEQKFLIENKDYLACHGLFFPQLVLEGLTSTIIGTSNWNILDLVPENLKEVNYIDLFQKGEINFYHGDLLKAENILRDLSTKVDFNIFPKFSIKILLLLARISMGLKQYTQGINFLEKALEISKLGFSSLISILEIHFKLMQCSYYRNIENKKEQHEKILQDILENYPNGKEKSKIGIEVTLWYIEWELSEKWFDSVETKLIQLKNAGKYGSNYEIQVNYWWSQFYYLKKDLPKMWAACEKNFKYSPRKNIFIARSYLDYVNQHFLQPNYSSFLYKGFQHLQKILDYLDPQNPEDIFIITEIYGKLIEICFQLHNDDLAREYQQKLTELLQIIEFYTG